MKDIIYKIYSEPLNQWCRFIILKKNDENGEDIENFNYEDLPDKVYGKQLLGYNNFNNVFMKRTVYKNTLKIEN